MVARFVRFNLLWALVAFTAVVVAVNIIVAVELADQYAATYGLKPHIIAFEKGTMGKADESRWMTYGAYSDAVGGFGLACPKDSVCSIPQSKRNVEIDRRCRIFITDTINGDHGTLSDAGAESIKEYKYCDFTTRPAGEWFASVGEYFFAEAYFLFLIYIGTLSIWLLRSKGEDGWKRISVVAALPLGVIGFASVWHYRPLSEKLAVALAVFVAAPAVILLGHRVIGCVRAGFTSR